MNELRVFENEGYSVRTLLLNNEPYFVLKDVCDVLELSNPTIVASRLEDDERTKLDLGRQGETTVVNESGLYSVILRSDKPKAKQFRKWVTSDVIPSIRKNGMYATDELLDNPDLLIQVATKLKEERQARLEAEQRLLEAKPKVQFYDDVAGSKTAINMKDAANVLDFKNVGRNKLFDILRKKHILDNDNRPYQDFIDRNYFRVVEQKFSKPNGDVCINIKTLVYQRGVEYISNLLEKEGFKKKELDSKLVKEGEMVC